jgi:RimJ/RimL family protein N-acetyltransferase
MIKGERITLRPVEERDHPLIHRWLNQPEVWSWMDYERPFSLQDVAESEARAREDGHHFVIEVDGRPIGKIGLNQFRRRDRICSMYVFLGEPDAVGRGYGRDAIAALLAHAFEGFDLQIVELSGVAPNERAIRWYESCGFVLDATLRRRSFKDGKWVDRFVMSVTREEYEKARSRVGLEG